MNNFEILMLIAVVIFVVFFVLPALGRVDRCYHNETFAPLLDSTNPLQMQISTIDSSLDNNSLVRPIPDSKNFESLIYDSVTGTIQTGSEFMDISGLITPQFTPPAWSPDSYGPSSKSEFDPADYENDPRLIYNKCSLSCCSPQYPTPFGGTKDPFVCDEQGNNKYLSSNYMCTNNVGGTGCLCLTERQKKGFENGFVDYYVDKENLGY